MSPLPNFDNPGMFNRATAHKQFKTMEKLHDNQTALALEKAGNQLDSLIRLTDREELQGSLWHMFEDSLCKGGDTIMPDDIVIRTTLYDTLRNIFDELSKVAPTPDHVFSISYKRKTSPR